MEKITRRETHAYDFMAKANEVERKWYVVDAEGQTLGRLASEVASILRGKTNLHLHHTLTRVIM